MSPPAFSPDGRFIVLARQNGWDWWVEKAEKQPTARAPDLPLNTRACQIGMVEIIDWERRHVREIAITTILGTDTSFAKPEKEAEENLISSPPLFLDNEHFTVLLPTKEIQTYSTHGHLWPGRNASNAFHWS